MGCCSSKFVHAGRTKMLPPFKVIILSVRDLPNVDVAMSKEDKKADPYVRIRFTEIETGKELKEFAKKTKAIVDVDETNFFELFNFNQMPHYGLNLHLEVLDKDFVTRDDFIGQHVLALGQKNDKGEWEPKIDFNEYTAEAPLLNKTASKNPVVVEQLQSGAGQKGFIKFRITSSNDVTVKLTEA